MGADGGAVHLMHQTSGDGGSSWTAPEVIDDRNVSPHINPVMEDGYLYWARSEAAGVAICRWDAAAGIQCVDTGAAAIDGLDVSARTSTAGLLVDGIWQVRLDTW